MGKTNNIPELRFPEFSGDWVKKKFGEIFSFRPTNSFSRENLNYESGEVKNIHYGDIHTKFRTQFYILNETVPFINAEIELAKIPVDNYCKKGDLIIADASEDYSDIGKSIELISLNNHKVLAGLHTLMARPELNFVYTGFSGHMMKSEKVRLQIKTIAQGTKVLSISTGRLSEILLDLPSLPEQQKVASFLTAVDEKLQTLKKKKTLLEQYKKGVLQKIFSQELRFKDDNGNEYPDWEENMLGDVTEFINGKAHENDIEEYGNYIVVNSKFVSTNGRIKKYSNKNILPLEKDDIVLVMSDVPNGKALGKCFLIDREDKYTLNQRICALRETVCHNPFLILFNK